MTDLVYGLDEGTVHAGVQVFLRRPDAVAYVRSLGFQGPLDGTSTEFTAGGHSYVLAFVNRWNAFVVADGSVAPEIYAAVIRYIDCTYAQDAQAD